MRSKEGKKLIAYLYAQNEHLESVSRRVCGTEKIVHMNQTTGDYYLYLYDVSADNFFPTRTKVMTNYYSIDINRGELFTLKALDARGSDVLIFSQYPNCGEKFYEAYGLWDNLSSLSQYSFAGTFQVEGKLQQELHEGRTRLIFIPSDEPDKRYELSISKVPGKLDLKSL